MQRKSIILFAILLLPLIFMTSINVDAEGMTSKVMPSTTTNYKKTSKLSNLSMNEKAGILFIIFAVIVIIYCRKMVNFYEKKISKEEFKKYIPNQNIDTFLKNRYDDYCLIHKARMDFDYNLLKDFLTDELYKKMINELDELKIKKYQHMVREFNIIDSSITSILEYSNQIEVKIELTVSFYDYIVNETKIISGSSDKKINISYNLTFIHSLSNVVDRCPKCHAQLDKINNEVCPYCRVVISHTGSSWVLAKIDKKMEW